MNDYSSIIDHPHHRSKTRPHMSMVARAAQFSPFAALVGYDESVAEVQRMTDERITLDPDAIAEINRTLSKIRPGKTTIAITCFIPDPVKEGGTYTIITGEVKKTDTLEGKVIMTDGTVIPTEDIFDIDII